MCQAAREVDNDSRTNPAEPGGHGGHGGHEKAHIMREMPGDW